MFLKARGYLQNKWSSVSTDELLVQLQAKIDAVAPVIEQWANAADAIHGNVETLSATPDFSYDREQASGLVSDVRGLLTSKGTSFSIQRKDTILFNKGAAVPEVNLRAINEIAEGLEMASVRLDLGEAKDGQKAALSNARRSFGEVLENFGLVVEKSKAALALPAIAGSKDDGSLTARSRDSMLMDLRYTLEAHSGLIGRAATRSGVQKTDAGAEPTLETVEPVA